jgi:hypothetical protein
METRRSLLKFFGAGTLIAPIIGGKAVERHVAELIERPNIRPVELFTSIPKPIDLRGNVTSATVLIGMKDGTLRRLEIENPQGWGRICVSASRVQIDFNEGSSPATDFGSIIGTFSL